MNFGQCGQLRHRLRAYLPVRWQGRRGSQAAARQMDPASTLGRRARSRGAAQSECCGVAYWDSLGRRNETMNKPGGRGATVSSYHAQVNAMLSAAGRM